MGPVSVTLDTKITDLHKRSPAHSTANFQNMTSDYTNYLSEETNYLSGLLDEIQGDTQLFNAGKQAAFAIDTNFNSAIEPGELDVFQKQHGEVSEAFVDGAKNYLLNPKIRPMQEKKRQAHRTG